MYLCRRVTRSPIRSLILRPAVLRYSQRQVRMFFRLILAAKLRRCHGVALFLACKLGSQCEDRRPLTFGKLFNYPSNSILIHFISCWLG